MIVAARIHHDINRIFGVVILSKVLIITRFGKKVYTFADMPIQTTRYGEVTQEILEVGGASLEVQIYGPFGEVQFIAQRNVVDKLSALIFHHVDRIQG